MHSWQWAEGSLEAGNVPELDLPRRDSCWANMRSTVSSALVAARALIIPRYPALRQLQDCQEFNNTALIDVAGATAYIIVNRQDSGYK